MKQNHHVFLYYIMLMDVFPSKSEESIQAFKLLVCEFIDSVPSEQPR